MVSRAASGFCARAQPNRGDGVIFHIADTRVAYEFLSARCAQAESRPFCHATRTGDFVSAGTRRRKLDYPRLHGPSPRLSFCRTTPASHPRVWVMLMNNGAPGSLDPTTVMLTRRAWAGLPWRTAAGSFPKVEVRLYSQQ